MALEQEAKDAVLEYSSSLSSILSIGESLFHSDLLFVVYFILFVISAVFINRLYVFGNFR